MQPKLVIKQSENVEAEGMQDAGHTYLSCSNCHALLADIWVTRPNETQVWQVKATCPFCEDESFIHEIKGGFFSGGYEVTIDEENNQYKPITIVEEYDTSEYPIITLKVKKANADVKAVKRR